MKIAVRSGTTQADLRWINNWIWITYGSAQMLIVYGLGQVISASLVP
jgi:hypothetical protein